MSSTLRPVCTRLTHPIIQSSPSHVKSATLPLSVLLSHLPSIPLRYRRRLPCQAVYIVVSATLRVWGSGDDVTTKGCADTQSDTALVGLSPPSLAVHDRPSACYDVTPYLYVPSATEAAAWCTRALGAVEVPTAAAVTPLGAETEVRRGHPFPVNLWSCRVSLVLA